MLRKTAIISLTLVMVMIFSSYGVVADQYGSVPVSGGNEYFDGDAHVWNTYVVWTRCIDTDNDNSIDGDEASWIMIRDISSGESWNITPSEGKRPPSFGYPHSARFPRIYNDRVIYRYINGDTYDNTLYGMYNITKNETWYDLPLEKINGWMYGTAEIFGDWIFYTNDLDGGGGTDQHNGYLFNYKTGDEEYSLSLNRPTYGFNNLAVYNNYFCWTEREYDSHGGTYTENSNINVLNMDNYKCIQIDCSGKSSPEIPKTILCDVYYDVLLFKVLETEYSNWDMYSYDLSTVDWEADMDYAKDILGNFNSPTPLNWGDMQGNITNVSVGDNIDAKFGKVWINSVYYQTVQKSGIIYKYDLDKNTTKIIIDIPFDVRFTDVHFDKVVWSDDRSGEYNIYRLTTNIEALSTIMMLSIPLIMVGVVVVLFWKAFSGGLGGGMS